MFSSFPKLAIRKIRCSDELFYWFLLLPALLFFFGFGLYPFIRTFSLSTHSGGQFVGLSNYKSLLKDPLILKSIRNTAVFVFGAVGIELLIGLISAFIMNANYKGQRAVRVLSFLPWALPTIVVGIMFKFMLADIGGVFNFMLLRLGVIDFPVSWLAEKKSAMCSLILADSWKTFPMIAFMLLAGFQHLPNQLYEAARIDGASNIEIFFRITLPLLKRIFFVILMLRVMQTTAYAYDIVYSLTKGGPGDSTQVLVSLAQKYSFRFMRFEEGAAVAVLALSTELIFAGVFIFGIIKAAKD